MIAADTSSLIAFFEGGTGTDVDIIDESFLRKHLLLPPVVLTELLSDPKLSREMIEALAQVPFIQIKPGYWERAGRARAKVLAKGFKARIADALIAQSCIDEAILLVTRDRDFEHFAKLCGLKLAQV